MNNYFAYGLVFASELDLAPLQPLEQPLEADVRVRLGKVSPEGIDNPRESRAFAQVGDAEVWLDIPHICRLLIRGGNEICVDPDEFADPQSVRLYVLGSAMGAILHQRGYLVLHANAVRMGEGAVLFAGVSGAGKSTTAAVLHQKGFEVLSDDVVAVDDSGCIVGGFPQIKLWQDALDKLAIARDGLAKIRLQVNKYSFPLPADVRRIRLPIKAVYFLDVASDREPGKFSLEPLEGIAKFNFLKAHTYRRHLMEGLGLKPHHMQLCARIAGSAHMAGVTRPADHFNAPELADFVIDDLRRAGILAKIPEPL